MKAILYFFSILFFIFWFVDIYTIVFHNDMATKIDSLSALTNFLMYNYFWKQAGETK